MSGQAIHLVESRDVWSLFRWASFFYFSFCVLALVGEFAFPPLRWLIWAWPYPFVLAFQKFVPVGFVTLSVAMVVGYAVLAPLAFYLQLRGPTLRSPQARAFAAIVLCVLVVGLLTFAAQVIAQGQGWPNGE